MDTSLAYNVMYAVSQAAEQAPPEPNIVGIIITAVASASVFAALITGLVQYLVNRRNSRITERKNTVDAESDLVTRYKEAAAEERAAKESAVQTVRDLLSIAERQVESLKGTVAALNGLIENLNLAANAQQEIIDSLTAERDRSQAALSQALTQIEDQKNQLLRHQQEILELTFPKEKIKELRQHIEQGLEH